MKKVLFIDRDGTILLEPADEQVDSFEKMKFYPGVIGALAKIVHETDFELVMVSNQDGLGTASFPENTFWPVQHLMLDILKGEGIVFSDILIDRSFPRENAPTRKPGTALLTSYMQGDYDLPACYVIGDRLSDAQLAQNLGCKAIILGEKPEVPAELCTDSWTKISDHLCRSPRFAAIERKTSETAIKAEINLDGSGRAKISTGLGFFDHMLEQLARHSGMDISIQTVGDLHVDEHHTIEDTALALGAAMRRAMGNKKGMQRFGFLLPMDEALAQVAIDFSGRPWLVWNATFKREKIGDMPTEMFFHFFKSFSDSAGCTLNITVDGENEHHKIESIFKAWAQAIKMAVKRDGVLKSIPSTKGIL